MRTNKFKEKNRNGERGFTLVETSISLVVMMVGALAISSLFVFSAQNNVGGGERALAMAVAQQQLEQARIVNFDDASLTAGSTTTTVRSGTRNYTVEKTITNETNLDNSPKQLKRIVIRVIPQTAGPNWMRTPVVLVTLRSTLAAGSYVVSQ